MDVQTMLNTPLMRVKLVTVVHGFLLVMAMQGHWLPQAYLFYNLIFVICLLWSIHAPLSVESTHFAALIDLASFFFDLICIIVNSNYGIFSLIFAIINLAARPFSLILLNRELIDRGGSLLPSTNRVNQTYEDIDRNPQVPPTQDLHI
ncbi:uncharacterized protein LOC134835668 isoform X2 [Culicoides brevitarsis]|uniref:uncharacterized protein LOC134835668 isoform X2 n=1 Tax=Culicoides brevitarsis TaxID=469753 RepID=UPI00307BB97F